MWLQTDPLASKYPGWSPYNYCLNNPVNSIDPNGEWVNFLIGAAVGVVTDVAIGKVVSSGVENITAGNINKKQNKSHRSTHTAQNNKNKRSSSSQRRKDTNAQKA